MKRKDNTKDKGNFRFDRVDFGRYKLKTKAFVDPETNSRSVTLDNDNPEVEEKIEITRALKSAQNQLSPEVVTDEDPKISIEVKQNENKIEEGGELSKGKFHINIKYLNYYLREVLLECRFKPFERELRVWHNSKKAWGMESPIMVTEKLLKNKGEEIEQLQGPIEIVVNLVNAKTGQNESKVLRYNIKVDSPEDEDDPPRPGFLYIESIFPNRVPKGGTQEFNIELEHPTEIDDVDITQINAVGFKKKRSYNLPLIGHIERKGKIELIHPIKSENISKEIIRGSDPQKIKIMFKDIDLNSLEISKKYHVILLKNAAHPISQSHENAFFTLVPPSDTLPMGFDVEFTPEHLNASDIVNSSNNENLDIKVKIINKNGQEQDNAFYKNIVSAEITLVNNNPGIQPDSLPIKKLVSFSPNVNGDFNFHNGLMQNNPFKISLTYDELRRFGIGDFEKKAVETNKSEISIPANVKLKFVNDKENNRNDRTLDFKLGVAPTWKTVKPRWKVISPEKEDSNIMLEASLPGCDGLIREPKATVKIPSRLRSSSDEFKGTVDRDKVIFKIPSSSWTNKLRKKSGNKKLMMEPEIKLQVKFDDQGVEHLKTYNQVKLQIIDWPQFKEEIVEKLKAKTIDELSEEYFSYFAGINYLESTHNQFKEEILDRIIDITKAIFQSNIDYEANVVKDPEAKIIKDPYIKKVTNDTIQNDPEFKILKIEIKIEEYKHLIDQLYLLVGNDYEESNYDPKTGKAGFSLGEDKWQTYQIKDGIIRLPITPTIVNDYFKEEKSNLKTKTLFSRNWGEVEKYIYELLDLGRKKDQILDECSNKYKIEQKDINLNDAYRRALKRLFIDENKQIDFELNILKAPEEFDSDEKIEVTIKGKYLHLLQDIRIKPNENITFTSKKYPDNIHHVFIAKGKSIDDNGFFRFLSHYWINFNFILQGTFEEIPESKQIGSSSIRIVFWKAIKQYIKQVLTSGYPKKQILEMIISRKVVNPDETGKLEETYIEALDELLFKDKLDFEYNLIQLPKINTDGKDVIVIFRSKYHHLIKEIDFETELKVGVRPFNSSQEIKDFIQRIYSNVSEMPEFEIKENDLGFALSIREYSSYTANLQSKIEFEVKPIIKKFHDIDKTLELKKKKLQMVFWEKIFQNLNNFEIKSDSEPSYPNTADNLILRIWAKYLNQLENCKVVLTQDGIVKKIDPVRITKDGIIVNLSGQVWNQFLTKNGYSTRFNVTIEEIKIKDVNEIIKNTIPSKEWETVFSQKIEDEIEKILVNDNKTRDEVINGILEKSDLRPEKQITINHSLKKVLYKLFIKPGDVEKRLEEKSQSVYEIVFAGENLDEQNNDLKLVLKTKFFSYIENISLIINGYKIPLTPKDNNFVAVIPYEVYNDKQNWAAVNLKIQPIIHSFKGLEMKAELIEKDFRHLMWNTIGSMMKQWIESGKTKRSIIEYIIENTGIDRQEELNILESKFNEIIKRIFQIGGIEILYDSSIIQEPVNRNSSIIIGLKFKKYAGIIQKVQAAFLNQFAFDAKYDKSRNIYVLEIPPNFWNIQLRDGDPLVRTTINPVLNIIGLKDFTITLEAMKLNFFNPDYNIEISKKIIYDLSKGLNKAEIIDSIINQYRLGGYREFLEYKFNTLSKFYMEHINRGWEYKNKIKETFNRLSNQETEISQNEKFLLQNIQKLLNMVNEDLNSNQIFSFIRHHDNIQKMIAEIKRRYENEIYRKHIKPFEELLNENDDKFHKYINNFSKQINQIKEINSSNNGTEKELNTINEVENIVRTMNHQYNLLMEHFISMEKNMEQISQTLTELKDKGPKTLEDAHFIDYELQKDLKRIMENIAPIIMNYEHNHQSVFNYLRYIFQLENQLDPLLVMLEANLEKNLGGNIQKQDDSLHNHTLKRSKGLFSSIINHFNKQNERKKFLNVLNQRKNQLEN